MKYRLYSCLLVCAIAFHIKAEDASLKDSANKFEKNTHHSKNKCAEHTNPEIGSVCVPFQESGTPPQVTCPEPNTEKNHVCGPFQEKNTANIELRGSTGQQAKRQTKLGIPLNKESSSKKSNATESFVPFEKEDEAPLHLRGSTGQEAVQQTRLGIPLNKQDKYPLNLEIGGYIKAENYYNSRQVLAGGNDQYELVPLPPKLDPLCKDINSQSTFNMATLESRANFALNGPPVFSAKARAVMEWDFWGSAALLLRARIRHSFIRLDWEDSSVLLGQFWHPIFIEECFADVINFNSGAPFETYARNPQIRVTPQFGNLKVILCASTQTDQFDSTGPIGYSTTYMRNSHLPDLHGQLQYKANTHVFGAGMNFQRLVPRLQSDKGYKVEETIHSMCGIGYIALNFENFRIHTKGSFVQNWSEGDTISGFAVHCINPITDGREYTNMNAAAVWMDVILRRNKLEPAIFGGYTKNLGASKTIIPVDPVTGDSLIYSFHGLGKDINSVWRISPRLRYYCEPAIFGVELEYTSAGYGTPNYKGRVENAKPIGNFRFLAAAWYTF